MIYIDTDRCRHKWYIDRERESPILTRTLFLQDQGPNFMTSFNLNYLLQALSPNADTLGVKTSTYKFWGRYNSVHSPPLLGLQNSCSFHMQNIHSTSTAQRSSLIPASDLKSEVSSKSHFNWTWVTLQMRSTLQLWTCETRPVSYALPKYSGGRGKR